MMKHRKENTFQFLRNVFPRVVYIGMKKILVNLDSTKDFQRSLKESNLMLLQVVKYFVNIRTTVYNVKTSILPNLESAKTWFFHLFVLVPEMYPFAYCSNICNRCRGISVERF